MDYARLAAESARAEGRKAQQEHNDEKLSRREDRPAAAINPIFLDSQSVVFSARDEASIKRSIWIVRCAVHVQEAAAQKIISVLKISTEFNLADVMTKYLKYIRWRKFMDYMLNISTRAKPMLLHVRVH